LPSSGLRVLIVDDSDICRSALKSALESEPGIVVVGEARDGLEAIAQVKALSPQLITMDLQMPRLGGLQTIERIMREQPTPILVLTDRPRHEGVDMTFASLSRGAVELLPKASTWAPGSRETLTLIERVKKVARDGVPRVGPARSTGAGRARPVSVVALGASTGGPAALAEIFAALPTDFPLPVLVVQHMDVEFHEGFVQWLSRQSAVKVAMASAGEALCPGQIRVAPQGRHLTVDRHGRLQLVEPRPGDRHVPSVDALFSSLAESHGSSAAAVLLTGMGSDGAKGLKLLRDRGALTVAQDRSSSVIYGMPAAAAELGAAEQVLALGDIAPLLAECGRILAVPTATKAAKKTILVVDDSPVVLEAVRNTLTDAGHEVLTADNPLIVPAMVRRQRIDLALIDVNMPAVAGDVVTKILAQAGLPGSKIVLYSDISERELEARAQSCGALGYIKKKADQHLVAEVARFLKRT
jgi:two-component system chemotaxis response regulator CheB